ncbi:MAG: dCTP deaminase, partial [Chloroflexi bacterium]|nr:dCTP deaminase [Chloroflexota bacterium]
KIGQISYLRLIRTYEQVYGSPSLGSKYQGQTMPTASRFHQDFERQESTGGDSGRPDSEQAS